MRISSGSRVSPSVLAAAQAELERRRRALLKSDLLDFVPRLTPRWERPEHLAPVADLFDRAETESVWAVVAGPPQHGKTELLLHGAARFLGRHPERTVGYVAYAAKRAHSQSKLLRAYTERCGVRLRRDTQSASEWRTTDGGGVVAGGIGGPFTGFPIQLLLVDDPHKNRAEAESSLLRGKVQEFFTSTALPRVHPGCSVIVFHTRWHEDDLGGWLAQNPLLDDRGEPIYRPDGRRLKWEVINLPAVNDKDEALWPAKRPRSWLRAQRAGVGEYDWWSMYMGQPRPRGGRLFQDVHYYERLPNVVRYSIGIDLAYSEKTSADWSVAFVFAESRGIFYVVDVLRMQAAAPVFLERAKYLASTYPGAPITFYGAGVEKGSADFFRAGGLPIDTPPIGGDKFVRAQPAAAAWNDEKIQLPRTMGAIDKSLRGTAAAATPEWLIPLVKEVCVFTGKGDKNDDQIDAMVAAYDALAGGATIPKVTPRQKYRMPGPQRGFG